MGQVIPEPASQILPAAFQAGVSTESPASATIADVGVSSDVVTITTSAAHGFQADQWVVVAAVTHTAANNSGVPVQIASVPSSTTFTYALSIANYGPSSDTGSASVNQSTTLNQSGVPQNWVTASGQEILSTSSSSPIKVVNTASSSGQMIEVIDSVTGNLTFSIQCNYGGGGVYGTYVSFYRSDTGGLEGQIGWENQNLGIQHTSFSVFNQGLRTGNNSFVATTGLYFNESNSTSTPGLTSIGSSQNTPAVIVANAGSAKCYVQNTGGEAALAANFTNATATLASTNLSLTVIAGRNYRIEGKFYFNNSESLGIQFTLGGGTATATTFWLSVDGYTGTLTAGTQSVTSLSSAITFTGNTGAGFVHFSGYLQVNTGGTLVVQAAESTTVSGTLTLEAGSWIALQDTVNL
jgi:hypothetical protein